MHRKLVQGTGWSSRFQQLSLLAWQAVHSRSVRLCFEYLVGLTTAPAAAGVGRVLHLGALRLRTVENFSTFCALVCVRCGTFFWGFFPPIFVDVILPIILPLLVT